MLPESAVGVAAAPRAGKPAAEQYEPYRPGVALVAAVIDARAEDPGGDGELVDAAEAVVEVGGAAPEAIY